MSSTQSRSSKGGKTRLPGARYSIRAERRESREELGLRPNRQLRRTGFGEQSHGTERCRSGNRQIDESLRLSSQSTSPTRGITPGLHDDRRRRDAPERLVRLRAAASTCLFNHHEQAAAMAAEGYARVSGRPALVNVTTGPGGINALTGVYGAWTDSIPDADRVGPGEARNAASQLRPAGSAPARRPGESTSSRWPRRSRSTRQLVTRAVSRSATPREGAVPGQHGRPGPVLARHSRSTCRPRRSSPTTLAAYDPADGRRLRAARRPAGSGGEVLQRLRDAPGARSSWRAPAFAWPARSDLSETVARQARRSGGHRLDRDRPGAVATTRSSAAGPARSATAPATSPCRTPTSCSSSAAAQHPPGELQLDVVRARRRFKIQVDVDARRAGQADGSPGSGRSQCDASDFLEELNAACSNERYGPRRHAEWLAWCQERVTRYPVVRTAPSR